MHGPIVADHDEFFHFWRLVFHCAKGHPLAPRWIVAADANAAPFPGDRRSGIGQPRDKWFKTLLIEEDIVDVCEILGYSDFTFTSLNDVDSASRIDVFLIAKDSPLIPIVVKVDPVTGVTDSHHPVLLKILVPRAPASRIDVSGTYDKPRLGFKADLLGDPAAAEKFVTLAETKFEHLFSITDMETKLKALQTTLSQVLEEVAPRPRAFKRESSSPSALSNGFLECFHASRR